MLSSKQNNLENGEAVNEGDYKSGQAEDELTFLTSYKFDGNICDSFK